MVTCRGLTVRKHIHQLRESAVALQSAWRGRVQRTIFSNMRDATTLAQATLRMRVSSDIFKSQLLCSSHLQGICQNIFCTSSFLLMLHSARVLQAHFRFYFFKLRSYTLQRIFSQKGNPDS